MKRFIALLLALLIASAVALPALATSGNVIFNRDAEGFVFSPGGEQSLSDLFPNFKDVMPGDKLTQPITVRNDSSNGVKVDIYVRSLGADAGSEDFLSRLNLKVAKSENNVMSYMFDASADSTGGMKDWVFLGTLYSGGEVNLDVTLDVPITLSSEYKNQIGYLKWEFKVEEFPIEPDDPEPPPTGDESPIVLYIVIAVVAAVVMIALLFILKRRKASDESEDY